MESNVIILTENLMKTLSLCILFGVVCIKLGKKLPIPDVVLFIIAGIILGPQFLNIINWEDYKVGNQLILSFGAAYILYDGGKEIQLKVLNKVKFSVFTLATVGVLITTFVTGYFAYRIFNIDFIYALLLGSVIASTDPSVLVPLFKKIQISDKLKQTIISESAFNDAASAIITFSIIAIIQGGSFSIGLSLLELLQKSIGGIIIGAIIGYLASVLVSDKKISWLNGYPSEIAVAAVLGAYFLSEHFHFSGFMSVFVVGIICGNKAVFRLSISDKHESLHLTFKEVLINMLRILIFIILGTQLDFSVLSLYFAKSVIVVLLFVFVARPLTVIVSVALDRKAKWSLREILYLMWTRETGVIPAALAGMIVSMNIQNSQIISSVTFMAIIITLTFQASTAKYVAKLLKLELH